VNNDAAKILCEQLLVADTESDVIALLVNAGYWDDPDCWRYYGDNELNWSQAGGQQGRADFALNEKAINSIDAVLTLKCLRAGIDPESDKAPPTIRAAVARFIENAGDKLTTTHGRVEDWPKEFRTKVAENISIFTTEASGSKRGTKPSVNIADLGEGHTPAAFPSTLVSLGKRNKASIPFVQGKFCQGGTGAVRHCGEQKLQLVISRRNSDLLASKVAGTQYPRDLTDHMWGFTIVRRDRASALRKVPVLTYLAPLGAKEHPRQGGVLRFEAEEMPLFPKGDKAYQRRVSWGTLIKLYAYQLKNTGNILRRDGLLYKLDLLLPDPALPIRIHECRTRAIGEGEASEQTTTMGGLYSRLQNSENLEDAPPISLSITIRGRQLIARVFAFKPGKGATYRDNEGVILTVNGQAHADMKASIFARKRVGLQRLAKDLLVVVDCSALDANERDDLFMTSRDRVAEESALFTELERSLEDELRHHPGLRELRNRRAREDLDEQLGDDKPLEAVLKQVLRNSPALAKWFGKGERLSNPFMPERVQQQSEQPKLHQHPTFFNFLGRSAGELLIRSAHLEQKCRIGFVTDAEDQYFTRKYDPGRFGFNCVLSNGTKQPVETFNGPNLVSGRASVSFDLPLAAKVGDQLTYETVVEDEVTQRTFPNVFTLRIVAAQATSSGPSKKVQPPGKPQGDQADGQAGLALPKVIHLDQTNPKWLEHFKDEHDCLDIIEDIIDQDGKTITAYTFYLNTDNRSLRTELKGTKSGAPVLSKQFEVGAVLVGLALIHNQQENTGGNGAGSSESRNGESTLQSRVQLMTRAMAPILLPMIKTLGELGEDDLVESDLVGQAAEAAL